MIRSILILAVVTASCAVTAATPASPKVVPLGKADAKTGGVLYRNCLGEPDTFNPINANDAYSRDVYENVVQGLLNLNYDTYQYEPEIAERYEVSKDFLTYTFFIDKDAKFSDGQPVTAEDVKFSVDVVKDPAWNAAHRIPYFEDIESVEVVDKLTVKFKMKKKYFKNLMVIGTKGFNPIMPKHIYTDPKNRFPVAPVFGSGPYKVEAYDRGKSITLIRDPNFWGAKKQPMAGLGKFERITFRFIKEENLGIEMVKKGQIDYWEPVRPESFEKKAVGEPFGTTVKKMQVENMRPKRYGWIGWNEKNPIFANRDTRHALSLLFNRKQLMEKFFYGKVVEAVGPVYYNSPYNAPDLKPVPFDPAKAKTMLAKAGWADKDKNGVLEKTIDGKQVEFRFMLLLVNRDVEKYFTMYKEDLKKAGIEMEIKIVEWNTFLKVLDDQRFDAVTMSWGGGSVEDDLKQIWHTESARLGGSNYISYSNKEVDKLIDQAREEMNDKKRAELWRKAVRLIANDHPYTLLFNQKYDLFLVNQKVGYDKPTYKYDFSFSYWYPAAL